VPGALYIQIIKAVTLMALIILDTFKDTLNPLIFLRSQISLVGVPDFAPKVAFEPKVGRLNQKSKGIRRLDFFQEPFSPLGLDFFEFVAIEERITQHPMEHILISAKTAVANSSKTRSTLPKMIAQ
jgi:hypothetical protein